MVAVGHLIDPACRLLTDSEGILQDIGPQHMPRTLMRVLEFLVTLQDGCQSQVQLFTTCPKSSIKFLSQGRQTQPSSSNWDPGMPVTHLLC